MMKRMFVLSALIAGQTWYAQSYYKEDFQKSKTDFPTGWNHSGSGAVISDFNKGINNLVVFRTHKSSSPIEYPIISPQIEIKNNTKLKFKIATTVTKAEDRFEILIREGQNEGTLVKHFSFNEIVAKGYDDKFTTQNPADEKYSKEVDLSAYAGKSAKIEFKILASNRMLVYLDDIELIVDETLATVEDTNHSKKVEIYPNPVTDFIGFKNIALPAEVEIYTADGRLVYNQKVNDRINVSQLTKGVYILQIIDKSGKKHTSKIIKK